MTRFSKSSVFVELYWISMLACELHAVANLDHVQEAIKRGSHCSDHAFGIFLLLPLLRGRSAKRVLLERSWINATTNDRERA